MEYRKLKFDPFVFFCGSESGVFILREEHRLRVFGIRLPRKIFGSKEEGVVEGW
jgi:hypothetical protein